MSFLAPLAARTRSLLLSPESSTESESGGLPKGAAILGIMPCSDRAAASGAYTALSGPQAGTSLPAVSELLALLAMPVGPAMWSRCGLHCRTEVCQTAAKV